jgi:hypothetical protein
LIKFGWDGDAAVQGFVSEENFVGDVFKFDFDEASQREKDQKTGGEILCECCYCEYELADVLVMPDCAHVLCSECFGMYLQQKIVEGPDCVKSSCPDHECENVVPESFFQKLLEAEPLQKY